MFTNGLVMEAGSFIKGPVVLFAFRMRGHSGSTGLFALVVDQRRRLDLVALERYRADLFLKPDADGLFSFPRGTRITDDIVLEDEVARLAADANACRIPLDPIVLNEIVFQAIAVACHAFGFVAKENPVRMVIADLI